MPAYIQDLFEQRLHGRGFGLHELGVLAATIEHLVHSEAIKRLGDAFKVHSFLPTSNMKESEADEVLDTYLTCGLNDFHTTCNCHVLLKDQVYLERLWDFFRCLQAHVWRSICFH